MPEETIRESGPTGEYSGEISTRGRALLWLGEKVLRVADRAEQRSWDALPMVDTALAPADSSLDQLTLDD